MLIKFRERKIDISKYASTIALIGLIIVMGIIRPEFRQASNLLSILRQASINGLIAFGMTSVILTGGIDLSVGSTLGLTAMIGASMLKNGVPEIPTLLLMVILGIVLGFINGILINKGKLQPFIATLATMTIFKGLTYIFSEGRPISGLGETPILDFLGKGNVLGIPTPVWILGLAFLFMFLLLNKSVLGRKIYAIGSNPVAAKLAGVKVERVSTYVYVISGALATLAGIILLSRLGSAQPTLGQGYETDAIAASALGGTSMQGGKGGIIGTITGILIIAVLSNGLNIMGVSSYFQEVVKGVVIVIAVLSDKNK